MREQWDAFILPQIVFNYRGITLDGYSLARIKSMTGVSIKVVSNVTQLLSALRGNYRGKQ
jgi:hypothetical protein